MSSGPVLISSGQPYKGIFFSMFLCLIQFIELYLWLSDFGSEDMETLENGLTFITSVSIVTLPGLYVAFKQHFNTRRLYGASDIRP